MIEFASEMARLGEQKTALEAEVRRQQEVVTRFINTNNQLWNALVKLPGGLEIARKITL